MRIEFICHACLAVDVVGIRILTDPWFRGAAYCGQWHLFRKPVDTSKIKQVDVVLISHGHEDHLRAESLP